MTPDPILILAATTILLSLAGLCLFARLRAAEREVITLKADTLTIVCRLTDMVEQTSADLGRLARVVTALQANERTFALDLARTADDLTDLRGEYLAQARALDAHDERLQALEDRP